MRDAVVTAAYAEALIIHCPHCHSTVGERCTYSTPSGSRERFTPCLARTRAVERLRELYGPQIPVQLDSGPSERDHTKPLHPQENQ